jgi:sugar lactone lactonase YvrE
MTCARSATWSEDGEKRMSAFSKILVVIIAGGAAVLSPFKALGVEAIKFRHVTSIYTGSRDIALKNPEGVVCDDQSLLIVADTGNARLLRYTLGDDAAVPSAIETAIPQITYPVRVKINSKKEIFVLDGKLRRIIRLAADGKFSGYIDPPAGSSAPSQALWSFHIDRNDNFYILDIYHRQLIVLSPQGKTLKKFDLPEQTGVFSDLTVDAGGNILLLDSVNARVFFKANDTSEFVALTDSLKTYMRFPTSMAIDKRGRIYLVDHNGGKIIILARDGSFLGRLSARGWKEGLLNHPSQICLNDRGEIIVADTSNNRVQIFAEIESK